MNTQDVAGVDQLALVVSPTPTSTPGRDPPATVVQSCAVPLASGATLRGRRTMWDVAPAGLEGMTPAQVHLTFPGLLAGSPFPHADQFFPDNPRIYIGNLPRDISTNDLHELFFAHLQALSLASPTINPILDVTMNSEKRFGFITFLTVQCRDACLSFDGEYFAGNVLKIRAGSSGRQITVPAPASPPSAALACYVLIGNLPALFSRVELYALVNEYIVPENVPADISLLSYASLPRISYALANFSSHTAAAHCCHVFHGMRIRNTTLEARLVPGPPTVEAIAIDFLDLATPLDVTLARVAASVKEKVPLNVIELLNCFSVAELCDDDTYLYIWIDMYEQAAKFGPLLNLIIPRPLPQLRESILHQLYEDLAAEHRHPRAVLEEWPPEPSELRDRAEAAMRSAPGLHERPPSVIVHYQDPMGTDARHAIGALSGARFGGRQVIARYF